MEKLKVDIDTLEGNKTLALFMGYTQHPKHEDMCVLGTLYSKWTSLRYHSEWNELMAVVDKIESLGYRVSIDSENLLNKKK